MVLINRWPGKSKGKDIKENKEQCGNQRKTRLYYQCGFTWKSNSSAVVEQYRVTARKWSSCHSSCSLEAGASSKNNDGDMEDYKIMIIFVSGE